MQYYKQRTTYVGTRQEIHVIMVISQENKQIRKYKELILQLIEIIVIKSKETRVIAYTCRYSSGHLIPIIQSCQDELGIKCPLESLTV